LKSHTHLVSLETIAREGEREKGRDKKKKRKKKKGKERRKKHTQFNERNHGPQ
jgi:hypothetical protein